MLRELFRQIVLPVMVVAIIGVMIYVGFMIKEGGKIAEKNAEKQASTDQSNNAPAPDLPEPAKAPELAKIDTHELTAESPAATSTPEEIQAAATQTVKPVKDFPADFTVKLRSAPYPYYGKFPDTGKDFYDYVDKKTEKKYHTNRYGTRYEEKGHYDDNSVLFYIPAVFNPDKKFEILLYFHGHDSELTEEMATYKIKEQIRKSGRNAILIAPELAKNAIDSSPGKFFNSGAFTAFMKESAESLTTALGEKYRDKIADARIIIIAFSGGYKSVAYILKNGDARKRISGIVLLDAMFEDVDKFEQFFKSNSGGAFLVSLFTTGCEDNNKELMKFLSSNRIAYRTSMPFAVKKGDLYFIKVNNQHLQVPIAGPPREPIANILKIIQG